MALIFISPSTVDEEGSLKKSELVNWYLKEMESEIETEEELISKKTLFEKVLHRLINYVRNAVESYSMSSCPAYFFASFRFQPRWG